MSGIVFFAILGAALMHALWNVIIKLDMDGYSAIFLLCLSQAALSIILLLFLPWPPMAVLPWIIASALLHTGYNLSLVRAYAGSDFSRIYPLARGAAPMLVAVVSTIQGDALSWDDRAAIILVCIGILMLTAQRGGWHYQQAMLGLTTAVFIASYTLIDAHGARISGTPLSFAAMILILDAVMMSFYTLAKRGLDGFRNLRAGIPAGAIAGGLSLASYLIVIWAFTLAPVALVAVLREISIVFALLLARLFLGESVTLLRCLAAGMILTGVVLIRL